MGLKQGDDFAPSDAFMTEEEAKALFSELHARATAMGLRQHQLGKLRFVRKFRETKTSCRKRRAKKVVLAILAAMAALVFNCILDWPLTKLNVAETFWRVRGLSHKQSLSERCLVRASHSVQNMARPPMNCEFCRGVSTVEKVANVSQEDFVSKYGYSGQPVVVTDGCSNWSAMGAFSFEFFRDLYNYSGRTVQHNCQFFPYRTDFENLYEVFEMDEGRIQQRSGFRPWYIGWSNCDEEATNILRQHYDRPYFLPDKSESSKTDWIFMGSPGYGAHMHVDNVGLPSWQAQIAGRKTWILQAPPECYFVCSEPLRVTVEPGNIIVLNTNKWYHSTFVEGNDVSITIGSEFD